MSDTAKDEVWPECPKCRSSKHVVNGPVNVVVDAPGLAVFWCLDCDYLFGADEAVIEECNPLEDEPRADDGIVIEDIEPIGLAEPNPMTAPEPEPEEDPSVCVQADDSAIDCAVCDKADNCALKDAAPTIGVTNEPAGPEASGTHIAVDGNTITSLEARAGQPLTEKIYRAQVDEFKTAILRHCDMNPTKDLAMCAAAFMYLRLSTLPPKFLASETIEILAELVTAFRELDKEGLVSREVTPPGARIN
jgi:hypothetical protein